MLVVRLRSRLSLYVMMVASQTQLGLDQSLSVWCVWKRPMTLIILGDGCSWTVKIKMKAARQPASLAKPERYQLIMSPLIAALFKKTTPRAHCRQ